MLHDITKTVAERGDASLYPSTWEVKVGRTEIQGHLDYIVNLSIVWAARIPVS